MYVCELYKGFKILFVFFFIGLIGNHQHLFEKMGFSYTFRYHCVFREDPVCLKGCQRVLILADKIILDIQEYDHDISPPDHVWHQRVYIFF